MNLKYKKMMLLLTMGVMGIGMISISFTKPSQTDANDTIALTSANDDASISALTNKAALATDEEVAKEEAVVSPSPTPAITSAPSNLLAKNEFPEINALVEAFLNAKLTCNEEDFKPLLKDVSVIDLERLQRKIEYIKNYHNINVYTTKAINEIDYVAYVTYDLELPIIETYAPSIDELYISFEDGKPYLYFGSIASDTSTYLSELRNSDSVLTLVDEVSTNLDLAITSDEDLREFYEKLAGTVDESADSTDNTESNVTNTSQSNTSQSDTQVSP